MQITDIKIRKRFPDGPVKAIVSITIDGCLAIHDIKIIQTEDKRFIAMPSVKDEQGIFRDIVHPIDNATRWLLETDIILKYEEVFRNESNRNCKKNCKKN